MNQQSNGLARPYFIGFTLSLVLTTAAFGVTKQQIYSQGTAYDPILLSICLVFFAILQLIVQLLFFFHLGRESKPRLNTVSFLFMLMVVGIIALGSLWIMHNLNYNMTEQEVETYIQEEELIYPEAHQHHH